MCKPLAQCLPNNLFSVSPPGFMLFFIDKHGPEGDFGGGRGGFWRWRLDTNHATLSLAGVMGGPDSCVSVKASWLGSGVRGEDLVWKVAAALETT